MKKYDIKQWIKCAGVRAVKTMAQTAVGLIGTSVVLADEEKEVLFPKPTPQPIEQDIINAQLMLEIAKLKAGVQ